MSQYVYAISNVANSTMLGGKRRLYSTEKYAKAAYKRMKKTEELLILKYRFDGFVEI